MSPRTAAVALAAAMLLSGACSGGESAEETTTSSTRPANTTSTSTSTTSTTVPPPIGPVLLSTLAPTDPDSAAAWLVNADAALHDAGDTAAAEMHALRQQLAYRTSAEHGDWVPAVRGALPERLRPAFDANISATRELLVLTKPRPALPPWRIVAPAPAAELLAHYREAESATGVPWQYLAAIHLVETRMGRIRGVSTAGAQGPMQFLPSTWAQYGEGGDIESNRDAILAAGRMLRRNGAPDRIDDALFSYNHSDHYVTAIKAYAAVMAGDEAAYTGYHGWQVLYRLESGAVLLPEGWQGR